jgi:hypothetical protein
MSAMSGLAYGVLAAVAAVTTSKVQAAAAVVVATLNK